MSPRYLLWQVGFADRQLGQDVFVEALGVAVGAGVILELANYLFFAKRQKIRRLTAEIAEARLDGRQLEQKIREASKL